MDRRTYSPGDVVIWTRKMRDGKPFIVRAEYCYRTQEKIVIQVKTERSDEGVVRRFVNPAEIRKPWIKPEMEAET